MPNSPKKDRKSVNMAIDEGSNSTYDGSGGSDQGAEDRMPAIPPSLRFSNRGNSGHKWKRDKTVCGALEVNCEYSVDFKAKFQHHIVAFKDNDFNECLELFEQHKMRKSFVDACSQLPMSAQCCGLIPDKDKTVKEFASALNAGWVKAMNKKLKNKGFKLSCFVWSWNNSGGKSETNILLIRFHQLSLHRLSTISNQDADIRVDSKYRILDGSSKEEESKNSSAAVVPGSSRDVDKGFATRASVSRQ